MKVFNNIGCPARLIVVAAALWFGLPARTLADTFTVTSANDSPFGPPGSLRAAIAWAVTSPSPGPFTINFDASLTGQTIQLTAGELYLPVLPPPPLGSDITKTLIIVGLGARQLSIVNDTDRVLEVGPYWSVTISDVTMTGHRVGNPGTDGNSARMSGTPGQDAEGGAIYNGASLTLHRCLLVNCSTIGGRGGNGLDSFLDCSPMTMCWYRFPGAGAQGGNAYGGAIFNGGHLLLYECCFENDSATGGDGGNGGSYFARLLLPEGAGTLAGTRPGGALHF